MESIFVLTPGFGQPHVDIKKQILEYNIHRIFATSWKKVLWTVCVYDETDISDISCKYDINVIREKGIVGEYIKKHATPYVVQDYDYVLLLLDDILLMPNVNFDKIIKIKKELRLDIVSPTLTLDSHVVYHYMLTNPMEQYDVKITSFCELFCFLMDPMSYEIYFKNIDAVTNPWLWGLDLILAHKLHLQVGMLNNMNMKHFFSKTCYDKHPDKDPFANMYAYLQTYDIHSLDVFTAMPCEKYKIKESLSTL